MTKEMQEALVEEWRPIDGFEGRYLVSSMGRILALPNNHHNSPIIRKPKQSRTGYLRIGLAIGGRKQKFFFIHRLVAKSFIANPNCYPQINHIDENKKNNCVENLEWCTAKMNANHGTARARTSAKQKNNVHPCPVIQKTLDGVEVARYASCSDIPRLTKFKRTGVVECLRGRIQTAYGYKWEYATKPWKEMA